MNILKKLFLSISVNSAALGIFTSRLVAGGGAGGAGAPPEIFRLELNSATKVEFFYRNGQLSMEAKVSKYCR